MNKGKSYAEAKPIAKPTDSGEYEFKSLCSNCHTIGGGDKVGPDLSVAIDSRERDWLTEYVVQPDVVRRRNDPIARMLAEKYPHVRMPNLYLTVSEAKSLLRYVELQKSHASSSAEKSAAAAPRTETPSSPSSPLIGPAIAIHAALAADSMAGVSTQAANLQKAAAALGGPAAAVAAAAADLAKQTSLEEGRRAFGATSEALVAYLKSAGVPLNEGVRVAYCPMVRKPWLQKDGPVANPYYGSRMLSCGEFTN